MGLMGLFASISMKTLYSLPSTITARSPEASVLGGAVDDCSCCTPFFASFSKYSQPSTLTSAKVPVRAVPL